MYTEEIILNLPKIEQHVHIVGSTRPETLLEILQEGDVQTDLQTLQDIYKFYQYTDFDHFLSVYRKVSDSITEEKFYQTITYQMLQRNAECNVKHVEAIWSPKDHLRNGLDYDKMLDYINRGIRQAKQKHDITCTIRIDLVRNYGPETANQTLDLIQRNHQNVKAIDIGGSEKPNPPEPYKQVYRRAKELGLHLCAHAGEAAGSEYIWEAINALDVERIGHGTSAVDDPRLLKVIAERGIGIEACPVSNLRTGVIKSLREHPIRSFINHGIKVSVNSDDPPMFNTDMNNEYVSLHRELGFTPQELFNISLNSIQTSYLSSNEKQNLTQSFHKEYEILTQK